MLDQEKPNGPELLRRHLKENGISQEAFAEGLGIHQSAVSRILRRAISPSLAMAFLIENLTDESVPARAFVELTQPTIADADPDET
ncbi:MAG: helix-turn-helix transcriptional regulator [Aliishimia sp.]